MAPNRSDLPDPQKSLTVLSETLVSLPREMAREPSIPINKMVTEGHALWLVAQKHREQLEAVGVEPKVIDSLPQRCQAVAGGQAQLTITRGRKRSTDEMALEARGQELRSNIVAGGRYATRTNQKAQSALDHIQEGTGLDDLVQDLKEAAVFVHTYAPDYRRIGEDPSKLEKECNDLAQKLQTAVVARRAGDDEESQALNLRNRAAAYLWEAMSEIRAAGCYAFRKDPDVLPLFRSAYRKTHRVAGAETPDGPAEPNPTA